MSESIPVGFCQCGCGAKTSVARQSDNKLGYVKGRPVRFIQGHNAKNKPTTSYKRCPECGEFKPREEIIGSSYCSPCNAKRSRAWREANKENLPNYWRQYNQRPEVKERARRRDRGRYKKRRERVLEYQRKYYEENKEVIAARNRAWLKGNPDRVSDYRQKRKAQERGAGVNTLTQEEWRGIQEEFGHRCFYCGDPKRKLTKDHVIPLSAGGPHNKENIVPACKPCNSRKGAKLDYDRLVKDAGGREPL